MAPGEAATRRPLWIRRLAPAAVAAGACLLAVYWVFLVPIFQAPDEPPHLDYALSLYGAGRLLTVRERPLAPPAFDLVVHPYAAYLEDRTDFRQVRASSEVPMPADYGTCAYYRELDQDAPTAAALTAPAESPTLITQYPFGFYALLAAWLRLVGQLTPSLVLLFYAARLFSVALLFTSLLLTYAVARELGIKRRWALGLTALAGFFPMTTFVSSYVQPDNLVFTLVSLSTYLTLRLRRRVDHLGLLAALGLALGLLLVTKWHIYLCLAPWLLAAVALARRWRSARPWPALAGLLGVPSLVLGGVQLWVAWGAGVRSYSPDGNGRPIFGPWLAALHQGPLAMATYVAHELQEAVANFYVGGQTFASFWGRFGYDDTPLRIGLPRGDLVLQFLLLFLTLFVLVLFGVSRLRVLRRLLTIAWRGRRARAVRLATADPLLNAYLTYTAFMVVLYVATDNFFAAQGRNWLPFLLAVFLVPLRYAPRALGTIRARRALAIGMLSLLAAYCALGSVFAVRVIHERFYVPTAATRPVVPFTCWALLPVAVAAPSVAHEIPGKAVQWPR